MEEEELQALEADLDAVGSQLATDRAYRPSSWKRHWLLWRPARRLVWTCLLIVLALVPLGGGPHWGLAVGASMALLPGRISKFRDRREELAMAGEEELFALYKAQVERETGRLMVEIFLYLVLALGALLFVWASPHNLLAQLGAAYFGFSALFAAFVSVPRNSRESRALETPEERAERERKLEEDEEEEEDDGPMWLIVLDLIWSLARVFVLYVGPIIVILSVLGARRASNPERLWILAGVMSVLWIVHFIYVWFIQEEDAEEES